VVVGVGNERASGVDEGLVGVREAGPCRVGPGVGELDRGRVRAGGTVGVADLAGGRGGGESAGNRRCFAPEGEPARRIVCGLISGLVGLGG
jgi:hypothetical protein